MGFLKKEIQRKCTLKMCDPKVTLAPGEPFSLLKIALVNGIGGFINGIHSGLPLSFVIII